MIEAIAGVTGVMTLVDKAIGVYERVAKFGKGPEFEAATSELHQLLIAAQRTALQANRDQLSLEQDKAHLAKRLAEFERWETEAEKYRLDEVGPGVMAYVLKRKAFGGEPEHQLCANCFELRRKAFLTRTGRCAYVDGVRTYITKCNACSAEYVFGQAPTLSVPEYADDGGGGGPTRWMGR